MPFARTVWKVLVGIKDGLALILLLAFFALLYAALSARPGTAGVQPGALLLDLRGHIVEEAATPAPFASLLGQQAPTREFAARDVIRALRLAAGDDRIKVVAIDLSRFTGGGQVNITDIGAALDQVRGARKPVLVYSPLYTDDAIQLAAHATEVWIDPLGAATPAGPGGSYLFYGPLLDKLKVTMHVFKVGTYKSAVEPYTRDSFSAPAKDNLKALYGALWDDWRADVHKARPRANIAMATTDPSGWLRASGGDAARAAVVAGLADRIGDADQFGARVAQFAGPSRATDRAGTFAYTALDTWLDANKPATPGRAIGVITVAGDIVPGKLGPGTAGGDRIAKLLDDALDDDLAALVVRVDSPGGALSAGEEIRAAVARYKARKIPVVVSMSNLTASAGYWISTPADRIFAEPATITGSIGVFAVIPSFERTLAEYDIKTDGVRTTPLSGQPDLVGGFSPEVSDMLQTGVEFAYSRFLDLVARARGKTAAQVDTIAQGRVWDGGTARQLGLVDQFGGLDEALAYAAKAAKLSPDGWHARYLQTPPSPLVRWLASLAPANDDDADAGVHDWVGLAARRQTEFMRRVLGDLARIDGTQGLQAYCVDCPAVAGTSPARPRDMTALDLLARLLALASARRA